MEVMTVSCHRLRVPPSGHNIGAVGSRCLQRPQTRKAARLKQTDTLQSVCIVNTENPIDSIKSVDIC